MQLFPDYPEMDDKKIIKTILHAGTKSVDFQSGAKVHFHFQTSLQDGTVVDDSRKSGKPVSFILGKEFKLPVWESIVQFMSVGEVAQFLVHKSLLENYPQIAKTLRDVACNKKIHHQHTCSMSKAHTQSLGYPDLDNLVKEPRDLQFIIELLKVENVGEYEKDKWQYDEGEKCQAVPVLKGEGNSLFTRGCYEEANRKYHLALSLLQDLMLREKPHCDEWNELNKQTTPLFLNIAQCELNLKNFQQAEKACQEALQADPGNVKGLYRRGVARGNLWKFREAREDLQKALELDPSLKAVVGKTLAQIWKFEKAKDREDKSKFSGKLFK